MDGMNMMATKNELKTSSMAINNPSTEALISNPMIGITEGSYQDKEGGSTMNNTQNLFGQTLQGALTPKKAVSYLRVSGKRQAQRGGGDDEGYSLPAQREANKRKAHSLGALIIKEFVERGESAKTSARNELQRMLEYVRENQIDYVIVNKVDRFARNRLDDALMTQNIREAGASLISATEGIDETPQGMLLHGILASIAEFYSQNLSSEVMKGLNQKVQAGGTPGLAPLGYLNISDKDELGRRASYVVVDEERAPLVKLAFELYASGDCSVLSLTEHLAARGLTSRATPARPSEPIKEGALHRILGNPYYKGVIAFNGALYDGKHEPLVDAVTWQKVQNVLSDHNNGERMRIHKHFLKSTVYCSTCGKRLIVHNAKSKTGKYYPYFVCVSKHYKAKDRHMRCTQRAVLISEVEKAVEELYRNISLPLESRQILEALLTEHIDELTQASQKEIADLEKQQKKLEVKQEKLLEAHYNEAITIDLMKKEQKKITKASADITERLASLNGNTEEIRNKLSTVLDAMENCWQTYIDANDSEKRLLNQAFFEKIDVIPGGKIKAIYTEPVELLVDPELKSALGDVATVCHGENGQGTTSGLSLTELAVRTHDTLKNSLSTPGKTARKTKTLISFFNEGLRKSLMVRAKGLEPSRGLPTRT